VGTWGLTAEPYRLAVILNRSHRVTRSSFIPAALLSIAIGFGAAPPADHGVFSSDEVLALTLSAPFNDLSQHGRSEDGYSVTGTLSYSSAGRDVTLDRVEIGLRGHTSIRETECAFPKLKVDFPKDAGAAQVEATIFSGLKGIKIGTHCGESTDGTLTAKYGRLPNQLAPHREATVYQLLHAIGVPASKARPAKISYVYTDAQPGRTPDQRRPIVRNAMLLENTGATLKRLGATSELTEAQFTNARERFTPEDTAMLAFAEAMIGNFDWCVRMFKGDTYRCDDRHPLWNVTAAVDPSGRARPIMYDFDVSGMVAGRHQWLADVLNTGFSKSGSAVEVEVVSQVQRTRSLFDRAVLDAARHRFEQRKGEAYRALESAAVDQQGRNQIAQYLDAFYNAIGSDEAFYRPVVTVKGTTAYADAVGNAPACLNNSVIPVGTPVSEPIEHNGQRVKVSILDALWHWAPPVKCDAIHSGTVWVEGSAIGTDFPTASIRHR
jgi:hypothetical protein